MILLDEQITLRAIEEGDAPILQAMINDPELEHAVVGYSRPVSLAEQQRWIRSLAGEEGFRWAIDTEEGMVGTAGVSAVDWKNRTANLNIKLLREARGRGYGTRAMALVTVYCFEELDLNCLTANVLAENAASCRLWEGLGFRLDGVLRQRVYKGGCYHDLRAYSLLRKDYYERDRKRI